MRAALAFVAVVVSGLAVAADRHVYLNSSGGGSQLNDCPNPQHAADGTSNKAELNYCEGANTGAANNHVICDGTPCSSDAQTGCCKSWTVTTAYCTGGVQEGLVTEVSNGVTLVFPTGSRVVYGHPQACVYNMAKSDSCEVHAGTYREAGAQCNAYCGDFSSGDTNSSFGTCHDWNCWLSSVVAFGFGPNLDGNGYGTAQDPGYLRGAVMNGSTDSWDPNGDKNPADGAYPAIMSGNRDGDPTPDFEQTSCVGAGDCSGDIYHALIVGCGGTYSSSYGQINCSLSLTNVNSLCVGSANPFACCTGSGTGTCVEEFVKIDSDADGDFDAALDAVNGLPSNPGVGTRKVDHFIVKDIEFRDYNQGAGATTGQGRIRIANINLNGDGNSDGLKLDHIYLHDNNYGASGSVGAEINSAAISDMQNSNCVDFTEVKNSFLEQNNRLLFADEGSAKPTLGCSWKIRENRILINVLGFNAANIPGIGFFKSIDHHTEDLRPKTVRFSNNEVIFLKAHSNTTNSEGYSFQFGQLGTSPNTNHPTNPGLGKGEIWMYGNIFRNRSDASKYPDSFFTTTIDRDCDPGCSSDWRYFYFNNTWDGWSSGKSVLLDGFASGNGVTRLGELFLDRNNVNVWTTGEQSTLNPPNAVTILNATANLNIDSDVTKCSGGSPYFVCTGSDPSMHGGLVYYTPTAGQALDGTGSCDPDGMGHCSGLTSRSCRVDGDCTGVGTCTAYAGIDADGDGDQDTTWFDIKGNLVSCPSTGSPIDIGAIQSSSAAVPAGSGARGARLRGGRVR